MKLKRIQKQLIIAGLIFIILTPLFTIVGTPILGDAICASVISAGKMCSPLLSIYIWMPFFFGPLLIGSILILIAFIRKK